MKKIAALLGALILALFAAVGLADVPDKPEAFAYAYDFDGSVLSERDMEEITAYGAALEQATGAQAVAVVVDFLDGMDPADYATDLINTWGIGEEQEDNGVVVLLARGDRKIQIGTGTGVDRILTGAKCGELIDENIDYFSDNRFAEGMVSLYADVCTYLATAQGKTLALDGQAGGTENQSSYVEPERTGGRGGVHLLDGILGLIFLYVIISVIFNALAPNRGGCLQFFFLGRLFGRGSGHRRPPRPPRGGFGPRPPRPPRPPRGPRPPRSGGFGGGFGGGFHGGGFGGGFGGGGFGGGGSRGGGGGRSF